MRSQYRALFVLSIIAAVLHSCNKPQDQKQISQDDQFSTFRESFIEALWKQYPLWASSVGYHNYDSILTIPDDNSRKSEIAFASAYLDSLKSFDEQTLSDNNRTDYLMIRDQLDWILWSVKDYHSYTWDPSVYNITGPFAEMLNNNYDSLETRLRNFYLRMKNIPAYYEAAKNNIANPTVEHTQLAIEQNSGGVSIFDDDLKKALDTAKLADREKEEIVTRAKSAADAVKGYVDWLRKLENKTPRSFRLGEPLYSKKFDLEIQSGYSVDQVYNKALAHKKYLHQKMAALATDLWTKYMG
ncbi:MAG TPA: DUF885 family protein, partial [Cyclobacteriaceae bacterium]|nr:DUF885 family protein [Cyclobacteriaceae bacterium]